MNKNSYLSAIMVLCALAVAPASAQNSRIIEEGGTGAYKSIMMEESTLTTHTIFRPQDLSKFGAGNLLPVIVWGNGGCANSPSGHINFLNEVASQGFLIVAIGPSNYQHIEASRPGQTGEIPQRPQGQGVPQGGMPGGMPAMGGGMPAMGGGMPAMGGGMPAMGGGMPAMGGGMSMGDPTGLQKALEWAIVQNEDSKSPYYHKLDTNNIGAAGMSCGGLQALHMSDDARIKTIMVMNSGLFNGSDDKASLNQMKTKSCIWVLGGSTDIAYENGTDDFNRITTTMPAFLASLDGVGHGGTYMQAHGGEYAIVASAWLKWQLKGDKEAGMMFTGDECSLSKRENWTIDKKNIK